MKQIVLPSITSTEARAMARGAKRAAAIANGGLAAYRMAGRVEQPRKGKGSYRRRGKHTRPTD